MGVRNRGSRIRLQEVKKKDKAGETLDAGVEPWVAEGETGGAVGETLEAGGNRGMQKVRQVMVQEVSHWMLEGTMGCRR